MTHDELLTELDKVNKQFDAGDPTRHFLLLKQSKALRAVVGLHKPEWVLPKICLLGEKPEPIAICTYCSNEPYRKFYPCSTIQAIEKELK